MSVSHCWDPDPWLAESIGFQVNTQRERRICSSGIWLRVIFLTVSVESQDTISLVLPLGIKSFTWTKIFFLYFRSLLFGTGRQEGNLFRVWLSGTRVFHQRLASRPVHTLGQVFHDIKLQYCWELGQSGWLSSLIVNTVFPVQVMGMLWCARIFFLQRSWWIQERPCDVSTWVRGHLSAIPLGWEYHPIQLDNTSIFWDVGGDGSVEILQGSSDLGHLQ